MKEFMTALREPAQISQGKLLFIQGHTTVAWLVALYLAIRFS